MVGPADFRQRTREVLTILRPTQWHAYVTTGLKRIVLVDTNSGVSPSTGVFGVTRRVAFTYDNTSGASADDSRRWYACVLVHERGHIQQFEEHRSFSGAEAEIEANNVQINCLRNIGAPTWMIEGLQKLNACIAAGGCRFWEGPRDY